MIFELGLADCNGRAFLSKPQTKPEKNYDESFSLPSLCLGFLLFLLFLLS
jgi:hypothetical protein